jgi:broad specificity phosphatase PhoE
VTRDNDRAMTVHLQLICHASTAALYRAAFPPDDEPLDERGRRSAAASAGEHRGRTALCGPARRCRETATALGLTAQVVEDLRDADAGRWTGRSLGELEPGAVETWLTDPAASPPGGESVRDVIDRVTGWLTGLDSGTIVAVTHPAVIRAAVVHALNAPPAAFWRVDVEPLAHVRLTGRDGRWNLRFPA